MIKRYILITFFSFFGIGFFPLAQGTFASFVVCLILLSLKSGLIIVIFIDFLAVIISIISLFLSPKIAEVWKERDPPYVVIDEVSGMLLSIFLLPKTFPVILISFLIFRFFDITKIPPIGFFDRMESPYGVMLDDIVAGIMTNISVRILFFVFPSLSSIEIFSVL